VGQPFTPEQQETIRRVRAEGHEYVLRWLGELTQEQRSFLLAQLAELDFERVRELAALVAAGGAKPPPPEMEPAPVIRLPSGQAEREAEEQAARIGAGALREDRVVALTVAGGQGTRFSYDPPKGLFPITPVRKKSLFQVHAEKVLAARRRYGCRMPWLVMTSPFNEEQTRAFFEQQGYFGLGEDSVRFFTQPVNPILDEQGRLLMQEKWQVLMGPDGHGGVFEALASSLLLPGLERAGFDLISYFQVDNPLVTVADERFLGHHLREGAEFSCKVVRKRDPQEGLGAAVLKSGKPAVLEYSELPDEMARALSPSGELRYLYGSIAVHIINIPLARRVGEGNLALPWHVAQKQYEIIDPAGQTADPQPKMCYKFERFVFDCMEHASACAFVEVDRASEFAPVKRQRGPDSPATCRAAMRAMWLRWLKEAGADVTAFERDPAAALEIGPLFATSAAELKEKLALGWRAVPPLVLDEPQG